MSGWIWLDPAVACAVHEKQLAEHGGAAGTRDEGLRESALARRQHVAACGEPDAAALAVAYGCEIARNHSLVGSNKRTASVAVELFLALDGFDLVADDADCVLTTLAVTAGDLSEDDFAAWIRTRVAAC